MSKIINNSLPLEKCPALVLNADYRPLSYYPLSIWCWQDSIKSVFLDRVSIVSYYDRVIRSPSFSMKLPSVIALKSFVKPQSNPNFTRFNVFLRDKFTCQYCGSNKELTFDHLLPRSKGVKQIGTMLLPPAPVVMFKREVGYLKTLEWFLLKDLTDLAQKIFTKMEKTFLQIICTKAGWTIYIGMSSLNLNISLKYL